MEFTRDGKTVTMDSFLKALKAFVFYNRSMRSNVNFTAEVGTKYIRIVEVYCGSRSVYCFLDMDGNIYKSATWKAPAKHVRGSIFDENFSFGKGLSTYGAAYLR